MFLCFSAKAVVIQPEDFESYALTNDWDPGGTGGHYFYSTGGDPANHNEIVTGTNGNTSQVLKVISDQGGGPNQVTKKGIGSHQVTAFRNSE